MSEVSHGHPLGTELGTGRPQHSVAYRIARLIVSAAQATDDFRSIEALCRSSTAGASASTVRAWCKREHVRAARLLDFARFLRAVRLASLEGCSYAEFLDVDHRTFDRMLYRGGLTEFPRSSTVADFVHAQRFLNNGTILGEIGLLTQLTTDCHECVS